MTRESARLAFSAMPGTLAAIRAEDRSPAVEAAANALYAAAQQFVTELMFMSEEDRDLVLSIPRIVWSPPVVEVEAAPTAEMVEAAQAVDAAVQAGEDPAPAIARLRQISPQFADMAERLVQAAADMAEGDRIRAEMTPAEREMGAEAAAGAFVRGRGGARPGAGRPATTGRRGGPAVSFRISPDEDSRGAQVLTDGETRSSLAQRLYLEEIERRERAGRAAAAAADPDHHPTDF